MVNHFCMNLKAIQMRTNPFGGVFGAEFPSNETYNNTLQSHENIV
jgi:hypothetical protein